jgi:large subunit ribosomal protein L24
MRRIKRNDLVMVTTGVDRGKTGKVLRVITDDERVVVEGLNMRYKHVRRSQQNPQGGRIRRENPMALSNVMPYCDKCKKGVRVKYETKDGVKRRTCVSCSEALPS